MNDLVNNFMKVLGDQPLSLALVLMNFLLLYFLFKQGNQSLQNRKETMETIVKWQEATQDLLANCVSKDVMALVIAALERDRETYRAMLPTMKQMPQQPTPEINDQG